MPLGVGSRAAFPPYGIGRIDRTAGAAVGGIPTPCFVGIVEVAGLLIEPVPGNDRQFSLKEVAPGFEVVIPMDRIERVARELVAPDVAREVLAALQPLPEPPPVVSFRDRLHRYDHALRDRSLASAAAALAERLHQGGPLAFADEKALHALERVVIGEIALVLEVPADRLLEEVRGRFRVN